MLKVYLLLTIGWLALTLVGFYLKHRILGRYLLRTSYIILLLLWIEFASVMALYIKNRTWSFNDQREYLSQLFEAHPYLVAVPRKNAHVKHRGISYTHNSQGLRGPKVLPKSNRLRIALVGGSTTYGAGVTDGLEWPIKLGKLLGEDYEVINFGVLGHSTVEHIGMLSLIVPEYRPDVLIIHAGFNDLRNMHVSDLSSDYSNFHAPTLYSSFNFCTNTPVQRFASGKIGIYLLQQMRIYPGCVYSRETPAADTSAEAEAFALHLYRRNLETLVNIAKGQGLKPIFVPQLLVRENVRGGRLRWWIPHVDDEALIEYLDRYNAITEEVARFHGLYYVEEVLQPNWTKEDFADATHLNVQGSQKFAEILQSVIGKLTRKDFTYTTERQSGKGPLKAL